MTPNVLLPPKARLIVYLFLVLVALAIAASGVWYTSVGESIPTWLIRAGAVASFVSAAPLTLAALNINRDDPALTARHAATDTAPPSYPDLTQPSYPDDL